jgi:hypothetical protein
MVVCAGPDGSAGMTSKEEAMRVRTVVSLLAAVIMAVAFAATPAQAAPAGASFGPYVFKNGASHHCMDVAYGSKADGGRVQTWDCYGGTPEQWTLQETSIINGVSYYEIINVNSGKCLDVPYGSKDWGVELQQWTCWAGDMQQWRLFNAGTNAWYIQNMRSGLCLDAKNSGLPGAALQQWDCNWGAIQIWSHTP